MNFYFNFQHHMSVPIRPPLSLSLTLNLSSIKRAYASKFNIPSKPISIEGLAYMSCNRQGESVKQMGLFLKNCVAVTM